RDASLVIRLFLIGQRSRLFRRQMGLLQQPFGNLRHLTTPPGTQTDIIPRATGSTDPAGKPTGTIPRGSSQEVQGHRKKAYTMFRHVPGLFYAPRRTWTHIHDDIERRPWAFLPLLLIGSLIPALSTWYGGTNVGWELFGSEDRRFLTSQSGALLGVAVWLAFVPYAPSPARFPWHRLRYLPVDALHARWPGRSVSRTLAAAAGLRPGGFLLYSAAVLRPAPFHAPGAGQGLFLRRLHHRRRHAGHGQRRGVLHGKLESGLAAGRIPGYRGAPTGPRPYSLSLPSTL